MSNLSLYLCLLKEGDDYRLGVIPKNAWMNIVEDEVRETFGVWPETILDESADNVLGRLRDLNAANSSAQMDDEAPSGLTIPAEQMADEITALEALLTSVYNAGLRHGLDASVRELKKLLI